MLPRNFGPSVDTSGQGGPRCSQQVHPSGLSTLPLRGCASAFDGKPEAADDLLPPPETAPYAAPEESAVTKTNASRKRSACSEGSRTRRAVPAAALGVILLLPGCADKTNGLDLQTPSPEVSRSSVPVEAKPTPSVSATPSTSPTATASPTTPPQTGAGQVLAGYAAYWEALRPLAALPANQRPAALKAVAVDPLYSAVLQEYTARDAAGKIAYGQTIRHPEVSLLQGDSAAIRDCQDTSRSGLMNKATGEKLTVGVPAYLRLSVMQRSADGAWRLVTVDGYPNAKC